MSSHLKSILTSTTDDRILKRKFKSKNVKGDATDLNFIKGPWSNVEKARVSTAVDNYLKEKNIPKEDLQQLIHPRKSKSQYSTKNFFQEILDSAKVNRSLDQLYWFMSRTFSDLESQGEKWTKEQDSKLRFLVQLKGHKWVEIEDELKRKDCRVRWEKISRSDLGFKTGRWSKEEEEKFIRGKKELEELYNITNPNDFNAWTELSIKVGSRSFMQCRNKFIHDMSTLDFNQEFKVQWSLEDDQILISRLMQFCSDAKDDSEIIWNNIASKDWQPWTGAFLQRKWSKLSSIISHQISQSQPVKFIDILNFAQKNIKEVTPSKYKHRDLLSLDENNVTLEKIEWSIEDSRELLSYLLTLFSNVQDEDDIDWDSLKFSCWDGEYLKSVWIEMKETLKINHSLTFLEAVKFCQENLMHLSNVKSKKIGDENEKNEELNSNLGDSEFSSPTMKEKKRKIEMTTELTVEEKKRLKKREKKKSKASLKEKSADVAQDEPQKKKEAQETIDEESEAAIMKTYKTKKSKAVFTEKSADLAQDERKKKKKVQETIDEESGTAIMKKYKKKKTKAILTEKSADSAQDEPKRKKEIQENIDEESGTALMKKHKKKKDKLI